MYDGGATQAGESGESFSNKLVLQLLFAFGSRVFLCIRGKTRNYGALPHSFPITFYVQKGALRSLGRTNKRAFTKEESVKENGDVVVWDQEFQNVCSFFIYKDNVFHLWEIGFSVWKGLNHSSKNKIPAIGTTSLNIAEFASVAEGKDFEVNIPLTVPGSDNETHSSLWLTLNLLEVKHAQEPQESLQRLVVPGSPLAQSGETVPREKDELSTIKAGLTKVKKIAGYVSAGRSNKSFRVEEGGEDRCSNRSEEWEHAYPVDSDSHSLDDSEEEKSDEYKDDCNVRKSFSYGTLADANCASGSFYHSMRKDDDLVYYSNRKSDVGCSTTDESTELGFEPSPLQSSKLSILPWRKRKLRSAKTKGEPLLKKIYGEEGGDDIDFDRRQLCSDDSLSFGSLKNDDDSSANRSSNSDFGEDNFAVGSWEQKEVISRDGQMKLQTQVFFASIDQRSEQAAGESACTALVAVIANWFHANRHMMPIKSQFDSLIREGSLEWRNLCQNETYMELFPDKHFDLETVLQVKICPLSVNPAKSFIGFFIPDDMEEEQVDFLQGAMSFDSIWDEISQAAIQCSSNEIDEPQVYIVSWNDHFFVLKVEQDAYFIIDSLGERLYEGCNQAYVLKFDQYATIHKVPSIAESCDQNPPLAMEEAKDQRSVTVENEMEVVCRGKESCKEYIKNFLAAVPVRDLLVDIKKGLTEPTLLHHRLQIEFNYTQISKP